MRQPSEESFSLSVSSGFFQMTRSFRRPEAHLGCVSSNVRDVQGMWAQILIVLLLTVRYSKVFFLIKWHNFLSLFPSYYFIFTVKKCTFSAQYCINLWSLLHCYIGGSVCLCSTVIFANVYHYSNRAKSFYL